MIRGIRSFAAIMWAPNYAFFQICYYLTNQKLLPVIVHLKIVQNIQNVDIYSDGIKPGRILLLNKNTFSS